MKYPKEFILSKKTLIALVVSLLIVATGVMAYYFFSDASANLNR